MDIDITVHLSPRQRDWLEDIAAGKQPKNGYHRQSVAVLSRMGLVSFVWNVGYHLTDLGSQVLWKINERKQEATR